MSEQSPEAPREEEPEVEGHVKAKQAEELAAWRSEGPGEPEGSDVEGHLAYAEPSERNLRSGESGEPEGPDVEGHMAPLGTEERPVRKPPSEEPDGPDVEGHMFRAGPEEPIRGESE